MKDGKVIPQSIDFLSSDVLDIARRLLGAELETEIDGTLTIGRIVETEAYRAPDDKASHAYGNKRTKRTETMFSEGGLAYIYLCYGIHHLFNIVTGPKDVPHAVLIRAIEPIDGIDAMRERRGKPLVDFALTSGPGSLTKALGITTRLNGQPLFAKDSPIRIRSHVPIPDQDIRASPRVGIDYAEECIKWPWRFRIVGNPWCSKAK